MSLLRLKKRILLRFFSDFDQNGAFITLVID